MSHSSEPRIPSPTKDMSEDIEHLRNRLLQTERAFVSFVEHLNGVLEAPTSTGLGIPFEVPEEAQVNFNNMLKKMHKNFLDARETVFTNGY